MPNPTMIFGSASYGIAALAFLMLAIVLTVGWKGRLQGGLLIVACLATAFWTGVISYWYWSDWTGGTADCVIVLSELFRNFTWITVMWSMLNRFGNERRGFWDPRYVLPGIALVFIAVASVEIAAGLNGSNALPKITLSINLLLAIFGVLLTETLYRNGSEEERWHNKFLCLSVGGFFAFDIFLYADAILLNRIDPSLVQAKGAVQLLVVPLLAIAIRRNRLWRNNLSLSHDIVLHSTTFIFGGLYLFLMAAVGFYIRDLGEDWGSIAQATFLFGAVVLLAVVLFSGTSRAYLKVFFAKHFFKERYNYREGWHRFIQTLSEGLETASLEERAILAAADIIESPGGAIWLKDGDRFVASGSRNLGVDAFQAPVSGELSTFLAETQWVVEIEEAIANPIAYPGLVIPAELRHTKRAWVIIPLWHHGLIGFMVLAKPRAPRRLVWEDFDLLKTVGRQIASYTAEQRADRALTEAREFEEFNRRYAFVIHDIKNIVSQLSLLSANFRKHSDNRSFLEDMIETVEEAVGKMNRITDKITATQQTKNIAPTIALPALLERVVAAKAVSGATLIKDLPAESISVTGDTDRLEAVIGHLVQNSIEATESVGEITVSLRGVDGNAVIEVTDNGPGMDDEFIRKDLFKPFRSTKGRGFGIGAYQCRAYARELGGRLDVESTPGAGTTMRMSLPMIGSQHPTEAAPVAAEPAE